MPPLTPVPDPVSRSAMTVLEVLIALLLQLCGHIPGVIYGIYVVTQE